VNRRHENINFVEEIYDQVMVRKTGLFSGRGVYFSYRHHFHLGFWEAPDFYTTDTRGFLTTDKVIS
jgi:hypothetical protein